MKIYDEFWRLIKHLKQEIINLKQVKRASTASKYYIYNVSVSDYHNVWKVTYKAGSQPILSEVISYDDTSLSIPSNNEQYIVAFSQSINKLTILSTREVVSVVGQ